MTKSERYKQVYEQIELEIARLPLVSSIEDIVPSEGSVDAEVFFIGEAPGYHESVQRRPFVGRSGQLLRKCIRDAGMQEADVFIANIVKARPPENRDPTPAEINAYKPYLDRELEIVDPRLIVTLGRFSMGKFLSDVKVSQVHGRLHKITWQGTLKFVLPLYHPAAALRNPQMMKSFVEDMAKIPKIIDWIKSKQADLELESSVKSALL